MRTTRAYRSKIGKLPFALRSEFNHRIRDGITGPALLTYINGTKEFKALKRATKCKRINAQNLSVWRTSGYRHWLTDQDRTAHIREITEFSKSLVAQSGGNIAATGCDILAGKILEGLSEIETPTKALVESLVSLKKAETNVRKIDLAEDALELKEQELQLSRKKFQRQTCELFIKWYKNNAVSKILTDKSNNNDAKTEALGRHLFADLWD